MKHIINTAAIAAMLVVSASTFAKGGSHGAGHGGGHSYKAATGTGASSSKQHVSGYTKHDGTHVNTHNRSSKDQTKTNNWSTKGNTNPDTGKPGTK